MLDLTAFRTDLYRHPNSNDIAFRILKKYYVKEKDMYSLKVEWWNIGRSHPPFSMGITERLQLSKEKFRQWVPYSSLFHLKFDSEIADKKTIDGWREQWYRREGYKYDAFARKIIG